MTRPGKDASGPRVKGWLFLLFVLLGVTTSAVSSAGEATPISPQPAPAPTPFPEAQPRQDDAGWQVRALVVAPRVAALSSRMEGFILNSPLQRGTRFAKGEDLVTFDCALQQAHLASVTAEWEGAEAERQAVENLSRMEAAGVLEIKQAKAKAGKARADIDIAKAVLRHCVIHAPFSGLVAEVKAHPHEMVRTGDPLLSILDDSLLEVEAVIPSRWLAWLTIGAPFQIVLDETGETVSATVSRTDGFIDSASQTLRVVGVLSPSVKGLIPGMSGLARFQPPTP